MKKIILLAFSLVLLNIDLLSQNNGDLGFDMSDGQFYTSDGADNWTLASPQPTGDIGLTGGNAFWVFGSSSVDRTITNNISTENGKVVVRHTGGGTITFTGTITTSNATVQALEHNIIFANTVTTGGANGGLQTGVNKSNIRIYQLIDSGVFCNIESNVELYGAGLTSSIASLFFESAGGAISVENGSGHLINVTIDFLTGGVNNLLDPTLANSDINNLTINVSTPLDLSSSSLIDISGNFANSSTANVTFAELTVGGDFLNSSGNDFTIKKLTVDGNVQIQNPLSNNTSTSFGLVVMTDNTKSFSINNSKVNFDQQYGINVESVLYNLNSSSTENSLIVTPSSGTLHELKVDGIKIYESYSADLKSVRFSDVVLRSGDLIQKSFDVYGNLDLYSDVSLYSVTMQDPLKSATLYTNSPATSITLGKDANNFTSVLANLTMESTTNLNVLNGTSLIVQGMNTSAGIDVSSHSVITVDAGANMSLSGTVVHNGDIKLLSDSDGNGQLRPYYQSAAVSLSGNGQIELNYYLNGNSNTGKNSNGDYWREIGIPSNLSINDITWGSTYNNDIQNVLNSSGGSATDPLDSYISYYEINPSQSWLVPDKTDAVNTTGPFQIWLRSGETINVPLNGLNNSNSTSFSLWANDSDLGTADWNHLYNQFTSNFDLETSLSSGGLNSAGVVMGSTAYVLTEYAANSFGYRTVVAGGGGSYGSIIPPGQAFWVNVSTSGTTNGNYDVANTTVSNSSFQLMKTNGSVFNNRLKLELKESDILHDYLLLNFNPNNNLGPGQITINDAYAMNTSKDNSPNAFIIVSNNKFIHKEFNLGAISPEFKLDYFLVGSEQVNLSLGVAHNSLGTGSKVYVYDRKSGQTHEITNTPYEFNHDPDFDESTESRMEIIISDHPLANEDLLYEKVRMLKGDDYIEFKLPANVEIDHIEIYSISGNKMKVESNSNNIYKINNYTEGVYILNAIFKDGASKTFKFIK